MVTEVGSVMAATHAKLTVLLLRDGGLLGSWGEARQNQCIDEKEATTGAVVSQHGRPEPAVRYLLASKRLFISSFHNTMA